MNRHLLCLGILLGIIALTGCQRGPLPVGQQQQQDLLEGLLKAQRDTGVTVSALAKEIARREAVEGQVVGRSPLRRDFDVARTLLVATRRAVHSEQWEIARADLDRLDATVGVMLAETPAAEIRTYLERAALALTGSSVGVEADVASVCMLAALDVALKGDDAPLVPDVAQELDKTKKRVDRGDYKDALAAIEQLIGTVSAHSSIIVLNRAAAGVRGARGAMDREAGLVVLAELDQLSDLLNEFGAALKGAPMSTEPAETEAEPEAADLTEAPEEPEARAAEQAPTTPAPEPEAGPPAGETESAPAPAPVRRR